MQSDDIVPPVVAAIGRGGARFGLQQRAGRTGNGCDLVRSLKPNVCNECMHLHCCVNKHHCCDQCSFVFLEVLVFLYQFLDCFAVNFLLHYCITMHANKSCITAHVLATSTLSRQNPYVHVNMHQYDRGQEGRQKKGKGKQINPM